jgi:hypothetical protein
LLLALIVKMDVEVPFGETDAGFTLKDVDIPGYEAAPLRLTLQQKPFRLETVIVELEKDPS